MFDFMKKKNDDNGIVVLRSTGPGMCGGTDATQDTRAPKKIESKDMILFDATSALSDRIALVDKKTKQVEQIDYISAFAAKDGDGTFLFLEKRGDFRYRKDNDFSWAYVKADVFPGLVSLVNETELAKSNGFHSETHGLPENFGGSVRVLYESGEKISFSDNQSPVLTTAEAQKTAELFISEMKGEAVKLPDVEELKEIRFSEERKDGGYTKATLTLLPDGTGVNKKASRYEEPRVFESEKPVDAETIAKIKKNIALTGMLAWAGLPESTYRHLSDKTITFVFADGKEIKVDEGKELPYRISGGFFNIELEMATKH